MEKNEYEEIKKEYLKNIKNEIDRLNKELKISQEFIDLQNNKLNSAWINTFSGKKLYPLNPDPKDICIKDIAHALSMCCRFTGHVKYFSSVAYHSVLVSLFCNPEDALIGLMHDASEYALTDISSPIKNSGCFEEYKKFEKNLQNIIYQKFCGTTIEPQSVKDADLSVLYTEARDLLPNINPDWHFKKEPLPIKIVSMSPEEAEKLFLNRFKELILLKPNGQELYDQFMAE